MERPWLPPARVVDLPGRGEMVCRVHDGGGADGMPWVLLLHGWTASADLQWFTAYEELGGVRRFVAVDHRGHGRGVRDLAPFTLEDAADDAAALVRELGIGPVDAVGYSMGGPITLLLAQRHPDLVRGIVLAATAMEFRSHRHQRVGWFALPVVETLLRSRAGSRARNRLAKRLGAARPDLASYAPWVLAEQRRLDPRGVREAGNAISRFDARPWAGSLGVPAVSLVTDHDRLVPPARQREQAAALHAEIVEVAGDHLVPWEDPEAFSRGVRRAVEALGAR